MVTDAIISSVGGAVGDKAPPEYGGSEKRIERKIDNLLLRAPLDLKSHLRRWEGIPMYVKQIWWNRPISSKTNTENLNSGKKVDLIVPFCHFIY